MLTLSILPVAKASMIHAIPDYGSDDCVSFKSSKNISPLDFGFGYACVSKNYCEVSKHGCMDKHCHQPDFSKGARTSLTNINLPTQLSKIIMAPTGNDLLSNTKWCLVQDGAGNFWALDKERGSTESFSLSNLQETVIPCNMTNYFDSATGCTSAPVFHSN